MKKKALIVVNLVGFLTFLWNDIDTLKKMGYDVSIAGNGKMSDGSDAAELKKLKKMKITFYQVDFDTKKTITLNNLKSYFRLKKIFTKETFDVIHCHTPIAGILTRLAAIKSRKKGCKVIYTSHGFAFTKVSSKKSWLLYYNFEKLCSKFCDAIITINHEDFNNAKTMLCKNVFIIPGVGLDTKKYINTNINKEQYKKRIGINSDDYVILSVGELSTRKNHQIVIKAISTLKNKKNIVYVVCGREVTNSGIENQLKELATANNVRLVLLGHRNDVAELYKCADVSALPSIREGLGMAGLEALASGIPLIGSNVQGIIEYLKNGVTGYLCDPYNAGSVVEAINKLMSKSQNELRKMSTNCVEMAKNFDINLSKKKMKEIYELILL